MTKEQTLFKTPYGKKERHYVGSGSRYLQEFGYEKTKSGRTDLVPTGQTDVYAKIQEALEETKIENILKRVTAGDDSVLRPQGIYTDTTQLPGNMIEAQKHIMNMENIWHTLPIDVKREYNFDKGQFVAAAGTDGWLKAMGLKQEAPKAEAPEVKTPKAEAKGEEKA